MATGVSTTKWNGERQSKASFKVKVPPEAKCSALSDLAKHAVDPAIKAASLAVLAKVIS